MKKEKTIEESLIEYIRLSEGEDATFNKNPKFEEIIKKNLDKIDWTKFKEGTKYRERFFMAALFGGIQQKYWINREYQPNYVFKKSNPFILDDYEIRIEKNFEYIQWMAKQGRIKVIKY